MNIVDRGDSLTQEEWAAAAKNILNATRQHMGIMGTLQEEAKAKVDELNSIISDAEEVEGELEEYAVNLEGLQAVWERAEGVREAAEAEGIDI